MQKFRDEQNECKQSADEQVAKTGARSWVLRCRSGCGRAHLDSFGYLLRLYRALQGFNEAISRMRAKARGTWGMVMEPPTIKATFNASITSSRFQPSSPQRTR